MFDLQKIKRAISGLGAENKKLANEVETAKKRREELIALPRSKEDLADVVDGWLIGQRGVFMEALQRNVNYLIQNPDTTLASETDLRIFSNTDALGMTYPRDGNLLGLLAPLIRESLRDAISELPNYPQETGAPWVQREKEITKLDKSIGDLEGKIENLKTSASEAGISLNPETEVVEADYLGGKPIGQKARKKALEKANQR